MKIVNLLKYIPIFFGINRDKDLAFNLATKLAGHVLPEYRFTLPQMTWWKNYGFNAHLRQFDEDTGFNTHRSWLLAQLIRLTAKVKRDTAECSVFKGCSSFVILKSNLGSAIQQQHHIIDSFEGLSEPSNNDSDYWISGYLLFGEKVVKQDLSKFSQISLHKGWIPARFNEVSNLNFHLFT